MARRWTPTPRTVLRRCPHAAQRAERLCENAWVTANVMNVLSDSEAAADTMRAWARGWVAGRSRWRRVPLPRTPGQTWAQVEAVHAWLNRDARRAASGAVCAAAASRIWGDRGPCGVVDCPACGTPSGAGR
jgi:hypothetical protein